jgi:DNA primase
MSGAKDPDEFIKLKGPEAFQMLIEGSENQVEYRLGQIAKKYDLSSDAQKVDYLKEAEDLLARLPNAAEREVYCRRVAADAGISADVLIGEGKSRRSRLLKRTAAASRSSPEKQTQPVERQYRYSDPASAVAEEGVIRLLYLDPALIRRGGLPTKEAFSSPVLGHIYEVLCRRLREGLSVSADVLGGELESGEIALLVDLLQKPETLSNSAKALDDYINRIDRRRSETAEGDDLLQILEERRKELK